MQGNQSSGPANETSPMDRYHRQTLLPQIGRQGQQRLAAARVLIVGCGAIGCAAAEWLARAGVGYLRLVDRDMVEWTNLQRQGLFDEEDARQARPKADAAANRLRAINSLITLQPLVSHLGSRNVLQMLDNIDLIVDGTDNLATRYLLNEASVKLNVPWIYGACVGTAGQAMSIIPGQTACLRCLFPDPPNAAELPSCDTAGVLGPATAIIGALQAAAAIRQLVQAGPTDLLVMETWPPHLRQLRATRSPQGDCPCCAQHKFALLDSAAGDDAINLCGRNAIQVWPASAQPIDLPARASAWERLGAVQVNKFFVRMTLPQPPQAQLTLFKDGRLLIQGLTDPDRARSLYARFVGV